jgi:hypothetical protein
MLNVTFERKKDVLKANFAGDLIRNIPLEDLVGPPAPEVIVNCREITRINSVGIRVWLRYFRGLAEKKVKVTLLECPPPVVEHFNNISNFRGKSEVESILVPYRCTICKIAESELHTIKEIKKKLPPNEKNCTHCGKKSVFDDITQEYFKFVKEIV